MEEPKRIIRSGKLGYFLVFLIPYKQRCVMVTNNKYLCQDEIVSTSSRHRSQKNHQTFQKEKKRNNLSYLRDKKGTKFRQIRSLPSKNHQI